MKYLSVTIFLLLLFLTSCGPHVTITPQKNASIPRVVALLPIRASPDISRERVEAIRKAFTSALSIHGFFPLTDQIIVETCGNEATCPQKNLLAQNYLVDGFVELTISSLSRRDFFAGYYNTLSGDILFTDPKNAPLIAFNYTERENGGLLFNSGQLIEGVLEQTRNTEDESFSRLSSRFAEKIASIIPRPTMSNDSVQESSAVSLDDITTSKITSSRYKICAKATPHSFVSLLIDDSIKSNLRESIEGTYCGVYHLSSKNIQIEARSPFGNSVRKEITIASPLKKPPTIIVNKNSNSFALGCLSDMTSCTSQRAFVYKASNLMGVYQRISEVDIPQSSWIPPLSKEGEVYCVVGKDEDGNLGVPELIN